MNIKRLPIAFLVLGLVSKSILIFLWKHWKFSSLPNLLIYYDPGARYFAEKMTRLFFDHGGITFAPGSNTCFEISLAIGFGIECLLAGFLLEWVLVRFQGQPRDEGPITAETKPGLKPSH